MAARAVTAEAICSRPSHAATAVDHEPNRCRCVFVREELNRARFVVVVDGEVVLTETGDERALRSTTVTARVTRSVRMEEPGPSGVCCGAVEAQTPNAVINSAIRQRSHD